MNRQTSFKILFILILLIACFPAVSQVVVERSKDKVVISGVPYYIHLVKKGETEYSISKAYGISPEILQKENPAIAAGLREGQSLRIPVRMVSDLPEPNTQTSQIEPKDESRFIYHKLQPGETIFFLSKKYGVSEAEIVQSNPGIDVTKLSLGYEIAIPKRKEPEQEKTAVPAVQGQKQPATINSTAQVQKDYYHKVIKGETLSSIARKYGVTLRELRRENRDLRFPQVGDYVKIPGMKVQVKEPVEIVVPDTINVEKEEDLYLGRLSAYTPVTNLSGSLDVAVLLPFYLNENARRIEIDSSRSAKGRKIYSEIIRSGDWIYPGTLGFLEMYEGILLAADTLRSLGLDINLHVYDIKNDTIGISELIRSGTLERMDLIIGPVYSRNLSKIAAYAKDLDIPVVSPVQLFNNSVLAGNPCLFIANPSLEIAQNSIAQKISKYYNQNIVFIHSDTSGTDPEVQRFKSRIFAELESKMPADEINFKEMIFYSRSVFGTDSVARLLHILSDKKENIVVIASEEAPVMIETIQDIYNVSKKFNVKVFGYPEMRLLKNTDPKFLFDLGLMIYSPYWIDYSSKDVKQFCSDFMVRFKTLPPEMSYAWEGFDIAYYFLSGLAIHGKEFIRHPEIHNPDLIYTQFDFRRNSTGDGFENHKLFLIRYSSNYDLEVVGDEENVTQN